ncbi:MAG: NUDIX domain-containing protein [Syntrophaceae bacterium]
MGGYIRELRAQVGSRCLFVPGVRALILNAAGEVLLQRRADSGRWGLPGGAVELGESAFEALVREVYEETGLTVMEAEPMALYSGAHQRFTYPGGDEVQCFALAFIVREFSGEPRPDGREGTELRFWPPGGLPHDLVPIHAATLHDLAGYRGRFILSDGKPPGHGEPGPERG